ncbi:hypothetical protein [Methylobacterium radiotolerans]|uniref:hypothetical protein n=1 Tax=Methylobacterium radiotolerans TaxID=31998 RepID=UPI00059ECD31|nr:hypothetical protein [Methylobacterium radiotolerans]GEN01908.1 hypothetical protein MRA01_64470 [Methylobacterium radiotolerans]
MTDQTRTLSLLQQISDLMDVDPAAFKQPRSQPAVSKAGGSVAEGGEVPTLQWLVRAYCALPTDEARIAAIRMIEALAAPEPKLAPA